MSRTPVATHITTTPDDGTAAASGDPFVAQLARLCRWERTRAKWVFVPSHAVGHTLGGRLARGGIEWANLRLVTPLDVATRMAAPFLLERGIDPSEEPLGPALVMRLLLDLPAEGGYFRDMAEHASLASVRLGTPARTGCWSGARSPSVSHRQLRTSPTLTTA